MKYTHTHTHETYIHTHTHMKHAHTHIYTHMKHTHTTLQMAFSSVKSLPRMRGSAPRGHLKLNLESYDRLSNSILILFGRKSLTKLKIKITREKEEEKENP